MGYVESYCSFGYTGSEKNLILWPRGQSLSTNKRATLYLWGHGNNAGILSNGGYWNGVGRAPAEYNNTPVITGDFGGQLWGYTTAQTDISTLWTYYQSRGVSSIDIDIIAISMGNLAGMNWVRANPGKCRRYVGINPVTDLSDVYVNNRGGYQAEIGSVYGGAPASSFNPASNAAACDTAINETIDLYYSTDDTIVIPSTVTTFATSANATAHSLGAVGHSAGTLDSKTVAGLLA